MTRTVIYLRICLLVGLGVSGCARPPHPQRDAINKLAAEVRPIGGEVEVLESGILYVNLFESKLDKNDTAKMTAILDSVKSIDLPSNLRLRALTLSPSQLDQLAACEQVYELDLTYCKFEPGSLSRLRSLKNLEVLSLAFAEARAEDLEFLGDLSALRKLDLDSTGATNNTVSILTSLPRLDYLYVNQTQVSNEGVKELAKIETLTAIGLGSLSAVTDKGLHALSTFKHLDELDIAGTGIMPQGIEDFLTKTSVDVLVVGPVLLRDPKLQELQKKYRKTRFW